MRLNPWGDNREIIGRCLDLVFGSDFLNRDMFWQNMYGIFYIVMLVYARVWCSAKMKLEWTSGPRNNSFR